MIDGVLERIETLDAATARLAVILPTEADVVAAYDTLCAEYRNGEEKPETMKRLYQAVLNVAEAGGSPYANRTAYRVSEILSDIAWEEAGPVEVHFQRTGFASVTGMLQEIACGVKEGDPALAAIAEKFAAEIDEALSNTPYASQYKALQRRVRSYSNCEHDRESCQHQMVERSSRKERASRTENDAWLNCSDPTGVAATIKVRALEELLAGQHLRIRGRWERGRELAETGAVRDAACDRAKGEVTAWVEGSRLLPYPVHIRGLEWKSNGRRRMPENMTTSCACPDAQELCKHVIATLYVWASTNGYPQRYEAARQAFGHR